MKIAAGRVGISVEEYRRRVVAGLKYCSSCREWHKRDRFGKDRSRGDGLDASCKERRSQLARKKYKPRKNRRRRGTQLISARDGDKRQARRRVNYQVEIGLKPHPNELPCTDCDHRWSPGERRHEYDHYLGYDAEHHLDVEVVCTTCHAEREIRKR